jgi:hypothetical protein
MTDLHLSPEALAVWEYIIGSALIVLIKLVCFILGFLTIRLGHQLISSGVKGEFKFSASFGGSKADLASVSPGLLFVLLGVVLIGYAMSVDKAVNQTVEVGQAKMDLPQGAAPVPSSSDMPAFGKSKKEIKK